MIYKSLYSIMIQLQLVTGSSMKKNLKNKKIISSILVIGFSLLFVTIAYRLAIFSGQINHKNATVSDIAPIKSEPVIEQDPTLLANLRYLGAEYTDGLALEYTDDMQSASIPGEVINPTVAGLYQGSNVINKIIILRGLEKERENEVIAHEYMHYIWAVYITEEEKVEILDKMVNIIKNDYYLTLYKKILKENGNDRDSELFPVICTLRSDDYIYPILSICNKFIDRSKLKLINGNYDSLRP